MNEPKRRGRPPKAKAEDIGGSAVLPVGSEQPIKQKESPSQAYAMRVWSGQSPSVTRAEKIRRCAEALKDQNLPTEGVEYPE